MPRFAFVAFVVFAAAVGALPAQFFIPDGDPTTGSCNIFPFGSTGGANLKYQQLVTAAELGNQAGLITGIGFAQCGSGIHHYDTIQVVLAHKPGAGTLVATFAQNLVTDVTTVVAGSNHDWNLPADSFQEVGLQNAFAYNGVDNLVVEVTVTGSSWTQTGALGSPGLRTGSHQRVYAANWPTTPPAVGTLASSLALKIEIDMGTAKVSSYGRGCPGSNGLAPKMSVSGTPQIGQTIHFDLSDGLANSVGVRILGVGNGAPFPIDLVVLDAAGCLLYQDLADLAGAVVGPTGTATQALPLPLDPTLVGLHVYSQWACADPTVNTFGWTTSNYVRVAFGS